ncbi:MAG: SH3 domain-containing protein [Candidatus Aminicenantales bacterium]
MKKRVFVLASLSLLAIFLGWLLAETLVVKVQSTHLRKNPRFYAQVLQALPAGEKVEKIGSQDGWIQVRTSSGVIGWVHSSAIEVQKFSLLALDKSMKTQASASEVALAGKGFNKQVEESYRAKHGELNFAWVDKMIQIKIPAAQVEEFMKKGKLGEFGGAQ